MQIIKDLRVKNNMTQQQLADKLGVSLSSVRGYENKMEIVPSDVLLKLSEIFNVSLDFLVGKQEEAFLNDFHRLTPKSQKIMNDLLQYFLELQN